MAGRVSSKDHGPELSQRSYLLMVSAGVWVSKEAGGAVTSQRLSWGMGKLGIELSEATVGEFELLPRKAEMPTVLLFIDPLGRVQGTVGSFCLW